MDVEKLRTVFSKTELRTSQKTEQFANTEQFVPRLQKIQKIIQKICTYKKF